MRQACVAIATILGLLASSSALGAVGTPIPFEVSSATVVVALEGSNETDVTGALPISVPFDQASAYGTATGTITALLVNGKIQVSSQGALVCSLDCVLHINVFGAGPTFDVPDIGEASTPVLLSFERVSGSETGATGYAAYWSPGDLYQSSLEAGDILTGIRLGIGNEIEGAHRKSFLGGMIPGDSVDFSPSSASKFELTYEIDIDSVGSATFDETYEMSASLPPRPAVAALPSQVGWLVGGVLIGLGMKVLRRPAWRGLAA